MKKLLLSALVILCAVAVNAQEKKNDENCGTGKEQFGERLLDAKLNVLERKLELTETQKTQFIPIYKAYDAELKATLGERKKPEKTNDVNAVAKQIKQNLDKSKKAIDVQKKYIDEFAKVLNAEQLQKFPMVEKQIQNKLSKRKHNMGDRRHHGKGKHGDFGPRKPHGHPKHQRDAREEMKP